MKKSILQISFLIATIFTVQSFFAQESIPLVQGAEISFDKSTHDYGQIEKSANGECVFVFTNNGNKPLKITNAKGSLLVYALLCTTNKHTRYPFNVAHYFE